MTLPTEPQEKLTSSVVGASPQAPAAYLLPGWQEYKTNISKQLARFI